MTDSTGKDDEPLVVITVKSAEQTGLINKVLVTLGFDIQRLVLMANEIEGVMESHIPLVCYETGELQTETLRGLVRVHGITHEERVKHNEAFPPDRDLEVE